MTVTSQKETSPCVAAAVSGGLLQRPAKTGSYRLDLQIPRTQAIWVLMQRCPCLRPLQMFLAEMSLKYPGNSLDIL